MRAWKSLGGRGGSALRLAGLFTCGASSARASLPHADARARPASRSSRVFPGLRAASLSVAPIAALGGRAATRLQSEGAAEISRGLRGDASLTGDLLAGAGREHAGFAGPRGRKVLGELVTGETKGSNTFAGERLQLEQLSISLAPLLTRTHRELFRFAASSTAPLVGRFRLDYPCLFCCGNSPFAVIF